MGLNRTLSKREVFAFLGVALLAIAGFALRGSVASSESVTLATYSALREGMTYAEAAQVVGQPGTEMSRVNAGGTTAVMYQWSTSSGLGNMTALFQDGKLTTKAQFGLN